MTSMHLDPTAVWGMISHESPQVQALVLASTDSFQAAHVLALIPPETRPDVVMRVAGVSLTRAGELMGLSDRQVASEVLRTIQERSPEIAEHIRDFMLTFSDLALALDDSAIQLLIQAEVQQSEVAKALRACTPQVRDKFLRNHSPQSRDFMLEELRYMPPVRRSEVVQAQKRILQVVNRLADEGVITIRTMVETAPEDPCV